MVRPSSTHPVSTRASTTPSRFSSWRLSTPRSSGTSTRPDRPGSRRTSPGCHSPACSSISRSACSTRKYEERMAGDRRRGRRWQAAAVQSGFDDQCRRQLLAIVARRMAGLHAARLRTLGRTAFNPENFATRDPINLLNLRGGVTARGGWEVSIWSRNLTNKDYLAESINPNGISWLGQTASMGGRCDEAFLSALQNIVPNSNSQLPMSRLHSLGVWGWELGIDAFANQFGRNRSCLMPAASNR